MATYEYDFALSFAGEDRAVVEEVANSLKTNGARVFYDRDYQADLLGKDLAEYFSDLYQNKAQYCVIFLSRAYLEKAWCSWERRAALARAFATRAEYILPYRLQDVELPSIPNTIGRADLASTPPAEFASLLLKKLFSEHRAAEILPGVFISAVSDDPEQVGIRKRGIRFGADDYGHETELFTRAVLRNVTTSEFRVQARVRHDQSIVGTVYAIDRRDHRMSASISVPAGSVLLIEVPLGSLLIQGDGDLSARGPVPLAEFLTSAEKLTSEIVTAQVPHVLSGVLYELEVTSPNAGVSFRFWDGTIRFGEQPRSA